MTKKIILLLGLILLCVPAIAQTRDVTLEWIGNAEGDLAGYKVYYKADVGGPPYDGTGAVEGDSPIDVGNVTTFKVSNLDSSKVWFFVVTAYDTGGLESDYSNEDNTQSALERLYPGPPAAPGCIGKLIKTITP